MKFSKPNIVISKCINFENCRYNGEKINDNFLSKLGNFVNYIPVCPEVEIGLGTPRFPIKIAIKDKKEILYQSSSGLDLTKKMNDFSKKFLENQKNIDGFILKNRSPSCGIGDVKIYDKIDSYSLKTGKGMGFFARNISQTHKNIPKEDEGRLKNFLLREYFLTKIFTLAEFRNIKKEKNITSLQDFQAKHKYLFMSYSPSIQVKLGQILAGFDKNNIDEIINNYEILLLELFTTEKNIGKKINAFLHIFGYFKKTCSKTEKDFFSESLDLYRDGRIPTSSIIHILKTWALRDNIEYILKQSILNPYPIELLELSDSGKVLEL